LVQEDLGDNFVRLATWGCHNYAIWQCINQFENTKVSPRYSHREAGGVWGRDYNSLVHNKEVNRMSSNFECNYGS
jgi:hypothetical protein